MTRLVAALAAVVLLAGCSSDGLSNQERDDQRYRECLAAGGSWSTDDTDWACDLP